MRVLIVKTSSLGDVVHTLPALSDAIKANPNIKFDWLVEESFAEIPAWHPAITKVIPVKFRFWRKNIWQSIFSGEIKKFYQQLREFEYDLIIDAQGLLKSAFLASIARGSRVGLDSKSLREPIASCFYHKGVSVKKGQHAVVRVRELFAKALGYSIPSELDYGIKFNVAKQDYLVFLHGTTWVTKLWPEEYWCRLAALAKQNNLTVKIPCGNQVEKDRAERIAEHCDAEILDKLSLTELAKTLAAAKACIAVDTGLAHLAAALSVKTVSVYGPTNPKLTATYGNNQQHLAADFPCAPCLKKTCSYKGVHEISPPCFTDITPEVVFGSV